MPSALASERNSAQQDDLDNYDVGDLSDNPFATPPPTTSTNKRKERDGDLGIDEEVSVQKRARVPNVKLDEERLLSEAGIPKLKKRAANLKLKGKGHEFSDASRLLSFYQLWLDDLFPKARFLDALTMVEKAGHKKKIMMARAEWINDGRPKSGAADDEEEDDDRPQETTGTTHKSTQLTSSQPTRPTQSRPKTPPPRSNPINDVPNDDDLYDATPRASKSIFGPTRTNDNDVPDDDDLEALMAEAETQDSVRTTKPTTTEPEGDDEEDLDALIAEAEAQDLRSSNTQRPHGLGSSSGNKAGTQDKGDDFADEEAAMQEMDGLW